ncbi:MAG TPA: hypothetical protein VJH37_04025 [Candidatus Nanoarchaeia archaeon]|nr:hypothetical protein [Candidatus Nanoarchaeia archaeon]
MKEFFPILFESIENIIEVLKKLNQVLNNADLEVPLADPFTTPEGNTKEIMTLSEAFNISQKVSIAGHTFFTKTPYITEDSLQKSHGVLDVYLRALQRYVYHYVTPLTIEFRNLIEAFNKEILSLQERTKLFNDTIVEYKQEAQQYEQDQRNHKVLLLQIEQTQQKHARLTQEIQAMQQQIDQLGSRFKQFERWREDVAAAELQYWKDCAKAAEYNAEYERRLVNEALRRGWDFLNVVDLLESMNSSELKQWLYDWGKAVLERKEEQEKQRQHRIKKKQEAEANQGQTTEEEQPTSTASTSDQTEAFKAMIQEKVTEAKHQGKDLKKSKSVVLRHHGKEQWQKDIISEVFDEIEKSPEN